MKQLFSSCRDISMVKTHGFPADDFAACLLDVELVSDKQHLLWLTMLNLEIWLSPSTL